MPNRAPAQIHAPVHAETAFQAQAVRTVAFLIKHRARVYAQRPMALETIVPGLAAAAPKTLVAVARQLIERERQAPHRWFGFGGEVPLLNAKAILLLARVRRRAQAQAQEPPGKADPPVEQHRQGS